MQDGRPARALRRRGHAGPLYRNSPRPPGQFVSLLSGPRRQAHCSIRQFLRRISSPPSLKSNCGMVHGAKLPENYSIGTRRLSTGCGGAIRQESGVRRGEGYGAGPGCVMVSCWRARGGVHRQSERPLQPSPERSPSKLRGLPVGRPLGLLPPTHGILQAFPLAAVAIRLKDASPFFFACILGDFVREPSCQHDC